MSFFDQLQQASFAGVPFGVLAGRARFGRRQAVHEYPFRDTPWVEDLGRATRRISLTGFLVENDGVTGGADVLAQRDAMIAASESPGPLTLVHPTLGQLTVSVPDGGLTVEEKWEDGRYFELTFSFIEAGQRLFPSVALDTGVAVASSFGLANIAIGSDFVSAVLAALAEGRAVIAQAIATAALWGALAQRLGGDATAIYSMTGELQGNYGRFFGGAVNGFLASAPAAFNKTATVATLVAQGSANLANITAAIAGLNAAAVSASPAAMATAAQAIPAAILAATVNPADAVRLLSHLANFKPDAFTTSSVIGQAMATTQTALGNLFRRSTVASLANASASYQPSSANDAMTVRNTVTGLLDGEIEIAGDNGEDATFGALRSLRQAVVTDLNTRGAALPPLKTVSFQASLPAAVLALRLYRDPSRAAELVSEANPPHPAFMPLSFAALGR